MSGSPDSASNIIDNVNTVFADVFKEYCDSIDELKIAVGYFYLGGFDLVKEKMREIKDIKIVMGDETDEYTAKEIKRGYEEKLNHELNSELNDLDEDDHGKIETLKEMHQFIKSDRLKIHIYQDQKFHAKAYIFKNNNMRRLNTAIIGSSNFSKNGMVKDRNLELNSIHTSPMELELLDKWFDHVWDESNNYKDGMLKILENSQPYVRKIKGDLDYLSPVELLKFMIMEFLDGLNLESNDTLAEFQTIGYTNALIKLDKLKGCIIADSVGLGKTYIGLKLIEHEQKK